MMLSGLAALVVVVLAWDQGTGLVFQTSTILALACCAAWIRAALALPGGIPTLVFYRLLKKLHGPGVDQTAEFKGSRARGRSAIQDGNRWLTALSKKAPDLRFPVIDLWRLCSLPLVLLFWLS